MIGYFGDDIIFEISDTQVYNFTGFKRETSARYASHEIIGDKPVTEYIGPGLSTISFTISLNAFLGVKPRDEMEVWQDKAESGTAEYLVIGGTLVGLNKWVVKSVSETWDTILNGGEVYKGKVDITLEEYVEEIS